MHSLPPNPMAPAWDSASAAPSLSRMAAAYGLPATFRVARAFISHYPRKSQQRNETRAQVHTADVMNYALSKTATMVKPTPIAIPTEPIGRIPRPAAPIERVKKADSEDR